MNCADTKKIVLKTKLFAVGYFLGSQKKGACCSLVGRCVLLKLNLLVFLFSILLDAGFCCTSTSHSHMQKSDPTCHMSP